MLNSNKSWAGLDKKEYDKQYNEEHKNYIKERCKNYANIHKEDIKIYKKNWRECNKEKINSRIQMEIKCECGTTYKALHNKSRHEKTKKHLSYFENNIKTAETI